MATLSAVFARISNGSVTVTTSSAQKTLAKVAGFGALSLTKAAMNKAVEKQLPKADGNGDGAVDVGEFEAAARTAVAGKKLPAWSDFVTDGREQLSEADLAALVKEKAKKAGGALGGMIDAGGVAKVAVTLLDDDADGAVSKAEVEELAADLAKTT